MKKRVFLTSVITIAVLVLTCGLLAIPGQFANIVSKNFSGYEVIFRYADIGGINYLEKNVADSRASVAGILTLVFILFALVSLVYSVISKDEEGKMPTAILGGSCALISGIIFLTMYLWMAVIYKGSFALHWLTYVTGAFITILGIALIVFGIMGIKENRASLGSKSVKYNYLKTNKKENN